MEPTVTKTTKLSFHKVFAAIGIILTFVIILVAAIWYFSGASNISFFGNDDTKVSTRSATQKTSTPSATQSATPSATP